MQGALIRVDASATIGTGHVMRCLALAGQLRERMVHVAFACCDLDGHLCDLIEGQGFAVHRITDTRAAEREYADESGGIGRQSWRDDAAQVIAIIDTSGTFPDWLIVDHYELDSQWETVLRPWVGRIMVIDDLGNRPHDCDLLVDQNLHDNSAALYKPHIATATRCFFGPQYSLLRPEFDIPELVRERDGSLHQLLVFFGGTDPGNQCARVLEALRVIGDPTLEATLVLGPANRAGNTVRREAARVPRTTVLDATDSMARLMARADLALGTCGIAAWERCALGLPSIVTITAANQRDDARLLHGLGACINLGDADAVTVRDWADALTVLRRRPAVLRDMGVAAFGVMQGRRDSRAELLEALSVGRE